MKRISVNKATIFFGSILFIMLAIFIGLCKQQRAEQRAEQLKFSIMWTDMVDDSTAINAISLAGVTVGDSIAFEYAASMATAIDLPEETPADGDSVCAYVSNNTVYIEHWHNYPHQQWMFRYVHGE